MGEWRGGRGWWRNHFELLLQLLLVDRRIDRNGVSVEGCDVVVGVATTGNVVVDVIVGGGKHERTEEAGDHFCVHGAWKGATKGTIFQLSINYN